MNVYVMLKDDKVIGYSDIQQTDMILVKRDDPRFLQYFYKHNNDLDKLETVDKPTADFLRLTELRQDRNKLLASCDWTQLPDAMDSASREAWTVYRQALRDLPDSTEDLKNIVWPTPPSK